MTKAPASRIAEAVATAGLLLVILRATAGRASSMVAAYIGAADGFTASTSFANPAAVVGRMLSNSFAGIVPASAAGFVLAQLAGAAMGLGVNRLLGRGRSHWSSPARLLKTSDESATLPDH